MLPPIIHTMMLCERHIIEKGSNRSSIISLFNRIASPGFPMSLRAFLFIQASGGQGKCRIELRITSLATFEELQRKELDFTSIDRVHITNFSFPIELTSTVPGKYQLSLMHKHDVLKSLTLDTVLAQPRGKAEGT